MKKELVAASAEPLILALLAKEENYGYSIIQKIRDHSAERIQWTDGMLYPVLHRLERKGWITSRWVESEKGRKRKYYALTISGRKILKTQSHDWLAVHATLQRLLKGSSV
ncbi:MAG: helix-turn-helix transcriptional regulator [Opitutaceae bacterium]